MSRAVASRYQPVLVALHWLLALMIIGLLCLGFFVLADMPNTDPKKLDILVWHMAGGMLIHFGIMLLRFLEIQGFGLLSGLMTASTKRAMH